MPKIYKYTDRATSEYFLNGSYRLTKLREFQDLERFGEAIGDPRESKTSSFTPAEFVPDENGVKNAWYINHTESFTFENIYVMCVSLVQSSELMQRFSEMNADVGWPAYDVCLEADYLLTLTKWLKAEGKAQGVRLVAQGPCRYAEVNFPRKEIASLGPEFFLVKHPEYAWQEEFRFVFSDENPEHPDHYTFDIPKSGMLWKEVKV